MIMIKLMLQLFKKMILFQLVSLAGEYTCLGADRQSDTTVTDECQVYVWGSNSSNQLAEGTQEKILVPKLSRSFTQVEQVR